MLGIDMELDNLCLSAGTYVTRLYMLSSGSLDGLAFEDGSRLQYFVRYHRIEVACILSRPSSIRTTHA